MTTLTCPCGIAAYADCCEPLHDGVREAETALELMCARYSAMALGRENFIYRSWHPRMRPETLSLPPVTWTGLEVLKVVNGGAEDDEGVVEFTATCVADGQPQRLRENSGFLRHNGRWRYVAPVADA